MMVFGKKCPGCGGRRLHDRPPFARWSALPLIRAYACADCHQQCLALPGVVIAVEHRKSSRKRMPPHFLIRINARADQYARIHNISEGGLCFRHQYRATPFGGPHLSLDLFNCNDGSTLEHIAAEIVATNEQQVDIGDHRATTLNYSVRFMHLSHAQRKVLRGCIEQYGLPLPAMPPGVRYPQGSRIP